MSDSPKNDKPRLQLPLGTLLLGILGTLIVGKASKAGTVTLQTDTAIAIAGFAISVICCLGTYAFQLWRMDNKRERVKFAKEMGRKICPCTNTGEIMIHCTMKNPDTGRDFNVIKCNHCGKWEFFFYDDVT